MCFEDFMFEAKTVKLIVSCWRMLLRSVPAQSYLNRSAKLNRFFFAAEEFLVDSTSIIRCVAVVIC